MILLLKKIYWWYYFERYMIPHPHELYYLRYIHAEGMKITLLPKEREILYFYVYGKDIVTIGLKYNNTRERIRQILCKIRRKFRAGLSQQKNHH